MHDCTHFYMNGEWGKLASERSIIEEENPATETLIGRVLEATDEDVDRVVRRTTEGPQVSAGLKHLESVREAAESFNFETTTTDDNTVAREPIGVCALSTPWNWPMNRVAAKVAPVLATGCTCVLKPSEISPLSVHLFAGILDEADVPPGVFNLTDGTRPNVGACIAARPNVGLVSFTGSTRAGVDVSLQAAPTVKRVMLELGGKSPNLVLEDAVLESVVGTDARLCMNNVGESCDASSRLLVPDSRLEEPIRIAKEATEGVRTADPASDEVDNSPIAYRRQYDQVVSLIRKGIDEVLSSSVPEPRCRTASPRVTSCHRPCSSVCPTTAPLLARRSPGRCCRSPVTRTRARRFASRTKHHTASRPTSSRADPGMPGKSRRACVSAISKSTTRTETRKRSLADTSNRAVVAKVGRQVSRAISKTSPLSADDADPGQGRGAGIRATGDCGARACCARVAGHGSQRADEARSLAEQLLHGEPGLDVAGCQRRPTVRCSGKDRQPERLGPRSGRM